MRRHVFSVAVGAGAFTLAAAAGSPSALTHTRIHDAVQEPGRTPEQRAARIDMSSAWGVIARASSGSDGPSGPYSYDNGFEALPLGPISSGQIAAGTFGGSLTGATEATSFFAQQQSVLASVITNDAIAGNTTNKLRMNVVAPQPPDGFFAAFRATFAQLPSGASTPVRVTFSATPSAPARLATDAHIDSLNTLWTHDTANVGAGFILDRVIWGGTNSDPNVSLPVGPIPHFYALEQVSVTTGEFVPLTFPPGYAGPQTPGPNGEMSPPVNAWFRVIHEFSIAGVATQHVDFYDGEGPVPAFQGPSINGLTGFDRFSASMSAEAAGSYAIDNLHAEGSPPPPPTPIPPPLNCVTGSYIDHLQWFNFGPLPLNERWSGFASDVVDMPSGSGDKVIRQLNSSPDNTHTETNSTHLPLSYPLFGNPLRLCVNIRLSDPNHTVRAVAVQSLTDNSLHSRVFIGRETPPAPYTNRVYVQTNPYYDPIDELGAPNPFANNPVLGVDVVDTGFDWPLGIEQNLCFLSTSNGDLNISIAGMSVFDGSPFINSMDRLAFESEQNVAGLGSAIFIDDVTLECSPNFLFVSPPTLSLVYHDNLEWGLTGVTIGAMDDDGDSGTPFRWASAPNMPIQHAAGANSTNVLRMENLFRDTTPTTPASPAFVSFTQAVTRLPSVVASSSRGWATRASYMLTDDATTRLWSPAHATSATTFALATRIAHSSVTQTLWHTAPNPAFTCPTGGAPAALWIDTGVSLASLGINHADFFTLSIHKNLAGNHTYRINGALLRDSGGAVVSVGSLASCNGASLVLNANLDALFLSSGDENTAGPGSILYADNIRAWALPCVGDTNDDGIVNFADLNNVLNHYGQTGPAILGNVAPDQDNNGVPDDNITNFADLNAVLVGFGVPCS
ncbi:MAG: hypothetical protein AB7G17_13400 [Phycisphaerales bacterium]